MEIPPPFDKGSYIFADPFSSNASGVSTYINLAAEVLSKANITCHLIKRNDSEGLEDFRVRLSRELQFVSRPVVLEAPETLAVSKYVDDDVDIHIRLHCSRSLGALIQGLPYSEGDVEEEQKEIARAKWVSAPSHIAVSASGHLFSLPDDVYVYPNPAPNVSAFKKKESLYDVAFLGRWQTLKGTCFVEDIINLLPEVSFFLGVDRDPKLTNENTSWMMIGSESEKISFLNSVKLLIVPSLFETASMVGLEAIASGTPVVCWNHLGLAEYFDSKWVKKVDGFEVNDFVAAIRNKLEENACVETPTLEVNSHFTEGVRSLLSCSRHISTLLDQRIDFDCLLNKTKRYSMKKSQSKFKRKLNKLRRDPKQFIADSALWKAFVRPGNAVYTRNSILAEKLVSPSVDLAKIDNFVDVDDDSRIQFRDLDKPIQGLAVALLMPKNFERAGELVYELWAHKDFSPFCEKFLNVGWFDLNNNWNVVDFINRIDLANKRKLEKINFVFAVDAPEFMVEAIRSCSTETRVILVKTKEGKVNFNVADAYIVPELNLSGYEAARRLIKISAPEDAKQLAIAMRKLVQEAKPRDIDLLLPVMGGLDFDPELINFNPSQYQGIVYLKNDKVTSSPKFDCLIDEFSKHVYKIMLLESVYMKYRTLCENVENGGSPAGLMSACLKDGVLLDVRT